jgi:hypothetical protein
VFRGLAYTASAALLATSLGAAPASASTSSHPPYDPHQKLGFKWGNGSRVVGDRLTLKNDAKPLTAKQFKGQHHYKARSTYGPVVAALSNGNPVVAPFGKPHMFDPRGFEVPYYSGSLKAAKDARFQADGKTLISPLGDEAGHVRIFRGRDKRVITLKTSDQMVHTALHNHRLYWDRPNEKNERWEVMSTSLKTGKTRWEAGDAMDPTVTDNGSLAVVRMETEGKMDSQFARPIRGVQLLNGKGTWLLRRHGAWPTDGGEQVLPELHGSTLIVPVWPDKGKLSETVIDLKKHKAWSVETNDATQNEQSETGLATWQLNRTDALGDPQISLVLNTETNALNELKLTGEKSFSGWTLNDRTLAYSTPTSGSTETVVSGTLR